MNTRRSFSMTGILGLAAAALGASAQAQTAGKKNKLVIQVSDNDPGKWGLALNNARNVQVDLGEDSVDLEIVVYGPGIAMLKGDSAVAPRVSAALQSGVKVVACQNTMKAQNLSQADMLPGIGFVPAGVVELMQKQQQGYAYLRP